MKRLFHSALLTACLWGIANLSDLPQSPQTLGQTLNSGSWFQIAISELDR